MPDHDSGPYRLRMVGGSAVLTASDGVTQTVRTVAVLDNNVGETIAVFVGGGAETARHIVDLENENVRLRKAIADVVARRPVVIEAGSKP